jgi:hypothetical protein
MKNSTTPGDVGGSQLTLSASVGVSIAGPDYQQPDRMLKNADVAHYCAFFDHHPGNLALISFVGVKVEQPRRGERVRRSGS